MDARRRQFALIGLGAFSRVAAKALMALGHEVLAVDPREDVVREVHDAQGATTVVQADPENIHALRELDVPEFDAVVVGRATDFEANILTVINLLELGARQVVAKAANDRHALVLARLGGERVRVVTPEREMAMRLALQLSGQDIMEAVWLDPEHGFAEVPLPAGWAGLTLGDTALRTRFGVLLVAIRRGERMLIAPPPEVGFEPGDRLVLLGRNDRTAEVR